MGSPTRPCSLAKEMIFKISEHLWTEDVGVVLHGSVYQRLSMRSRKDVLEL